MPIIVAKLTIIGIIFTIFCKKYLSHTALLCVFCARTDQCVHQHIADKSEYQPETIQIADNIDQCTLNHRKYSSATDHYHEDARCHLCVFSQSDHRQVEDCSPHHRCAQAAKDEHEDTESDIEKLERQTSVLGYSQYRSCRFRRNQDCTEHQAHSYHTHRCQHRATCHL